jgi:hypothetical protein
LQAVEGLVEHRRHVQRRELDLVGGQFDTAVQHLELVAAEVGDAEVEHLAILPQARKGFGDLVEVHQRVRTVDQQQVEAVGMQLAQRFLGGRHDVGGAGVVMLDRVLRALIGQQLDAALADQLHALAQARLGAQRFAEVAFDAVVAIDVGMVERSHAHRDALLDEGDALLDRHVPVDHAPHAGDDAGQFEAAFTGGDARAGQVLGQGVGHRGFPVDQIARL